MRAAKCCMEQGRSDQFGCVLSNLESISITTKEGSLSASRINDCFWDVLSRKWTLTHSKRIQTGPNDPVPCRILQRASFWSNLFSAILTFSGHSHMCSFMDFQCFGLYDELNALAGLPNEPMNESCATWHLPGSMGPATAQWRPTFLHWCIFGLSELRGGDFEITHK